LSPQIGLLWCYFVGHLPCYLVVQKHPLVSC
jgi:hypothetical protein